MSRVSVNRMTTAFGQSQEALITSLVMAGRTNDNILKILVDDNPVYIKGSLEFDAIKYQRLQEAIRSVRCSLKKDDSDIEDCIEYNGDSGVKSISAIEYKNVNRFSSGMNCLDNVYGHSDFVYLDGPFKGKKTGHIEYGLPESFLSLWAGSPGVGKSRFAIAVTKSLNILGHKVLYINGEAEESQFRSWCGMDVDPDLFLVHSSQSLRLESVVDDIYEYQPKVVFIDSIQMILSPGGIKSVISRLKALKNEEKAGKPHIIMISQLNKKGEVAGSKYIEHMVDFVGCAKKDKELINHFVFECTTKNRGGSTPKSATFVHSNGTVIPAVWEDKGNIQDTKDPAESGISN